MPYPKRFQYILIDSSKNNAVNFNNNFDLLRLLASLSVTFSHSFGWVNTLTQTVVASKYGLIVFFTISGYLITGSLKNSPNVQTFVKKRILRIYPLLILTVFVILITGAFITTLPFGEYFKNKDTLAYCINFTGFSSRFPLPSICDSMNGSLWSIAVELRLYVGILLLSFLGYLDVKLWVSHALLLFTLIYSIYVDLYDQHIVCYFAIYFWMGSYLYLNGEKYILFWQQSNRWILLLLLYSSIVVLMPSHSVFGTIELILIPLLVLTIGKTPSFIDLRSQDYSYSMYLFSPLVQRFLMWYYPFQNPYFHFFASLVLLFPLGWLSWNFFEKRFLRLKS